MRTPFVLVLASGVLAMLAGGFFLWRGRPVRRAGVVGFWALLVLVLEVPA